MGPDTEDGTGVGQVWEDLVTVMTAHSHRNAALIGRAVQHNYRLESRARWQAGPAWAITSSAGSPALWLCISQDLYGTTQRAWWKRTR